MARAHIILPDELLARIDGLVGKRKRSEFITEVLEKEVRRRRRMAMAEEMMGSLKDVDIPGWETSESTVEWVREQRRQGTDHWAEYAEREEAQAREREPNVEKLAG
jgi:metal-responsive CopG/Arc/MetJ family transcriptional regulator